MPVLLTMGGESTKEDGGVKKLIVPRFSLSAGSRLLRETRSGSLVHQLDRRRFSASVKFHDRPRKPVVACRHLASPRHAIEEARNHRRNLATEHRLMRAGHADVTLERGMS